MAWRSRVVRVEHDVKVVYIHGSGVGTGRTATLAVDGELVAEERIERTVGIMCSMIGNTFDVGVDTGAPVGPY